MTLNVEYSLVGLVFPDICSLRINLHFSRVKNYTEICPWKITF